MLLVSGVDPYESGGHAPNIYFGCNININVPPMFDDFNLETASFSIQLIANASIFSARNLRMSRSVLFSEQPWLNWFQMSPVLYVVHVAIGVSDESIWAQAQDMHCSHCIWSNECVWSTLGQVNWDSVCGRCYAAVPPVLGNGVTWPNNFRCLCTRGDWQQFGKSYIRRRSCTLLIQNPYR